MYTAEDSMGYCDYYDPIHTHKSTLKMSLWLTN
jgi:hypothetical protein